MNKTDSFLHRLHLRARERQIVRLLRNQVAAASSILEVVLAILVLIGLLISTVPIAQEMFNLVSTRSTEAFQTFLGHAFNLVIGIEFIKMLAKHSPGDCAADDPRARIGARKLHQRCFHRADLPDPAVCLCAVLRLHHAGWPARP